MISRLMRLLAWAAFLTMPFTAVAQTISQPVGSSAGFVSHVGQSYCHISLRPNCKFPRRHPAQQQPWAAPSAMQWVSPMQALRTQQPWRLRTIWLLQDWCWLVRTAAPVFSRRAPTHWVWPWGRWPASPCCGW